MEEKINATLEFVPIAMGEYAQKMQLKAAGVLLTAWFLLSSLLTGI